MFRKRDTHIHFVGIGGIGMSGIAEVLVNLGYKVTGTDIADSDTTRRLTELGATVFRGHSPEHLGDADVVVTSSAVGRDNSEVVAARQRKIPVIPRAEMLAELMRLKEGIAVAGSHGKTTTTSLIAAILAAADLDPTVVIGGKVNQFGSNARLGHSDLLLAEADESDGSFLYLSPTFAVITNIDNEHLDHYGTFDRVLEAFVGFANRVPFYGGAVVCLDDPNVATLLPQLHKSITTYAINRTDADYVAAEVRHAGVHATFRVLCKGHDRGTFTLHMPGIHNVANALAAIAIADLFEIPSETIRRGLEEFSGVQRRFTLKGEVAGVMVVDDYGHHPPRSAPRSRVPAPASAIGASWRSCSPTATRGFGTTSRGSWPASTAPMRSSSPTSTRRASLRSRASTARPSPTQFARVPPSATSPFTTTSKRWRGSSPPRAGRAIWSSPSARARSPGSAPSSSSDSKPEPEK